MSPSLQPLGRMTTPVLMLALTLLAASPGSSGAGTAPVIDGNGEDLILFGQAIGPDGCMIDWADSRDDVAYTDQELIPCSASEDTDGDGSFDYYVNGNDLRRFVAVHDRTTSRLFLLFRAEGRIGDVEGNGDPDNNICVPASTINDQIGIGSQEMYDAYVDVDLDGNSDVTVRVSANQVTVTGATTTGASFAYRADTLVGASGHDLEVAVDGLDLPTGFRVFAFSTSTLGGMGGDATASRLCGGVSSAEGPTGSPGRPAPNPFAGATTLVYAVQSRLGAEVEISVHDLAGRRIRTLVSEVRPEGLHAAAWDGRLDGGRKAGAGVYFLRTRIQGVRTRTDRVLYLGP